MARVTVEDCLENVDGIFNLVKIASKRARRIANGGETLLENEENDTLARTRTGAPGLGIVHYLFWPVPNTP